MQKCKKLSFNVEFKTINPIVYDRSPTWPHDVMAVAYFSRSVKIVFLLCVALIVLHCHYAAVN